MTTPVGTPPAIDLPTDPTLLAQQGAVTTPTDATTTIVTSPINPATNTGIQLPNLDSDLYDLSPESHIMRLAKVLLGDSGAGQLRKRMTLARLEMSLFTTQFLDIDTFAGGIFHYARMSGEKYTTSPYSGVATNPQWQQQAAQDDSYRSRVSQFLRGLNLGCTPRGIAQVAQAITGVECDIVETFVLVDENGGSNPGGAPAPLDGQTYGDIETDLGGVAGTYHYEDLEAYFYEDLEGGVGTIGRTTSQNRSEFIVIPRKPISPEEQYILMQVLTRLKPAGSLLTISAAGVEVNVEIPLSRSGADSVYWEVVRKVAPAASVVDSYPASGTPGTAVEQPMKPLTEYQGEAWSYNSNFAAFASYTETSPGVTGATSDYQQLTLPSNVWPVDFGPEKAPESYQEIMAGRSVSDGILTAAPYPPQRTPSGVSQFDLDILGAGVS